MNTKIYIRFTEDIYSDIERGYSFYFRTNEPLDGLCAWSTDADTEYMSRAEILEECKRVAKNVLKGSYGGYSSESEVAIITGKYAGSGNDGVLIQEVEYYDSFVID